MAKQSHRDVILSKGMEVMHRQGYNGTSVRDIVRAAAVPQGSFTNHFASKEAFALEVVDLYYARSCKMMRETLGNEALSPLGRIRAYIEAYRSFLRQHGCQHGCLCGNFAAEASDQSEPLRKRTAEIFEDLQRRIVDCLKAAVKAGEVSRPMKYRRSGELHHRRTAGRAPPRQEQPQPAPPGAIRTGSLRAGAALKRNRRNIELYLRKLKFDNIIRSYILIPTDNIRRDRKNKTYEH